jgi:hypothetical protein
VLDITIPPNTTAQIEIPLYENGSENSPVIGKNIYINGQALTATPNITVLASETIETSSTVKIIEVNTGVYRIEVKS